MNNQPLNSGDQPPLDLSPVVHIPCQTGSPSIRDFTTRSPNDWPTEHEENGNYLIRCRDCGCQALGPKRAFHCWTCTERNRKWWDSLTEEQMQVHLREVSDKWNEVLRGMAERMLDAQPIVADPRARSLIPRANEETAVGLSDQIDLAATERARGAR